jgi:MoxR-like ATPase
MNAVGMDARKLWERVELWPHPAAESRLPLSATRLPMPSGRFAFPLDGVYLAPAGHDEARRTGYSRLDEFLLVLTISHHGTCAPMTVRSASQAGTPTAARLALVLAQLGRIVVGKDEPLRLSLACLLARGHLLIEDIPGVGKSTLAQALAATLGLKYARVQFTSDLLPADVLGVSIYDERTQSFRFHAGPIFNSVVLADEINRAPPKTQSALLEAMEERQVSQDGQTRRLPDPFFVIATQNPIEQIGAYPLPESQLDRFLLAIELGYPDPAAERDLLAGGDRRARIGETAPLADPATLADWQREAAEIHVAPALLDYVQALLAASRGHGASGGTGDAGSRRGLSPRAGLMLLSAARAYAMIAGRPMVLPEDVQAVFPSVAGHRLAGGTRAGAVQAQSLLRAVPLP